MLLFSTATAIGVAVVFDWNMNSDLRYCSISNQILLLKEIESDKQNENEENEIKIAKSNANEKCRRAKTKTPHIRKQIHA